MSHKLYAPLTDARWFKILVAGDIAGVQIELVHTMFPTITTEEFLAKNPLGKVPVLETPEGQYIFESNAILRYVARINPQTGLYGTTLFQNAQVDQWLDVVTNEIEPSFNIILTQVLGYYPANEENYKLNTTLIVERLQLLENQLKKANTLLVSEHITIADIYLATLLRTLFSYTIEEKTRKNYPTLLKWYETVTAHQAWLKHFGRTRYCKIAFPLPKAQAHQEQKEEKPKQEKQDKPAKQEQKKEAKPEKKVEKAEKKPEPKPAQDEEEAPVKKEKNPLDLLPPSTFSIDDYKRQYFLDKDVKRQLDLLFQQVDTQGWSFWEILYNKTENEGRILIVTKNMRNGYLQRMDPKFRNYAFGVHGVYGEAPNFQIAGAWLWRGTELPFEIKDHPSYEFHTYNRIDITNEEQRNRWASYWLNQEEGTVNGLPVQDVEYIR